MNERGNLIVATIGILGALAPSIDQIERSISLMAAVGSALLVWWTIANRWREWRKRRADATP